MWILYIRDVRYSSCFERRGLFKSETKEALEAFVLNQQCTPYKIDVPSQWGPHQITKNFKVGSFLEWADLEHISYEDIGTRDEAAAEAAYKAMDEWDYHVSTTPDIGVVRGQYGDV